MHNQILKLYLVTSDQVILISSSEDLTKALADKLSQRTGCEVRQLGKDIQGEAKAMMDDRDLGWKEVAYMGKLTILFTFTTDYYYQYYYYIYLFSDHL